MQNSVYPLEIARVKEEEWTSGSVWHKDLFFVLWHNFDVHSSLLGDVCMKEC